jgi:hypothetical protein
LSASTWSIAYALATPVLVDDKELDLGHARLSCNLLMMRVQRQPQRRQPIDILALDGIKPHSGRD